jgi:hypothetical protein
LVLDSSHKSELAAEREELRTEFEAKRERRVAVCSGGGEFRKDEMGMGIGIGRETGLDWFELKEFAGFVAGEGRQEEGRGEAGGN